MNEAGVQANASLNALLRSIIETISTSPQAPSWREQVDLDQLAAQVEARLAPRVEALLERVVLAAVKQELKDMVASGHLSAVVERRDDRYAPGQAMSIGPPRGRGGPEAGRNSLPGSVTPLSDPCPPKPAQGREIYGMFDRSHG